MMLPGTVQTWQAELEPGLCQILLPKGSICKLEG